MLSLGRRLECFPAEQAAFGCCCSPSCIVAVVVVEFVSAPRSSGGFHWPPVSEAITRNHFLHPQLQNASAPEADDLAQIRSQALALAMASAWASAGASTRAQASVSRLDLGFCLCSFCVGKISVMECANEVKEMGKASICRTGVYPGKQCQLKN